MSRFRSPLCCRSVAGALVCAAALAAPAAADVVVDRLVRADVSTQPGREGAGALCPAPVERPRSGERVRLSAAPDRARRDEPAVSFIVDLASGRAYVLDHHAQSYSELAWPPPAQALATKASAEPGPNGQPRFAYRLIGSAFESVASRDGTTRVSRAARVGNGFAAQLEVEVEVQPDATLGPAALAVETFAQAVRGGGGSWLTALGAPAGLLLNLSEELQQRGDAPRYRESAAAAEPATLDAALFSPPPGYARVEHRPDCF